MFMFVKLININIKNVFGIILFDIIRYKLYFLQLNFLFDGWFYLEGCLVVVFRLLYMWLCFI